MGWIGVVLALLVTAILLVVLIGSLLPRNHVASMTLELRSPAEKVWALVSDVGGTARWRTDLRRVEMIPTADGSTRFVETSRHGAIPFEVVLQEPPRRQVVRVVDDGQPFGGTWTWEIEGTANGSRLTLTEAGFVKNPVFRLASRLFFKPTATLEAYLRALAAALGETATPREAR